MEAITERKTSRSPASKSPKTNISDLHSHILPGVDDGSDSVSKSVSMLCLEAEQGVGLVAATPHFYPSRDTPEGFLKKRYQAAKALRSEMTLWEGLPKLVLGAEVHFFRGISESEFLPWLTIGKSSCVMIEMPPAPWPEEFYRELEAIGDKRGLTPIIAHVDRYIRPLRTYGIPERLSRMHVYVQANGSFFLDKRTSAMAMKMLKAGQIHLLGSDCHNLTSRKPNLGEVRQCIQQKLGPDPLIQIRKTEREILLPAHRRTE